MKKFSFLVAGVAGLLAASTANAGTLEDVRAKVLFSVESVRAFQVSQTLTIVVSGQDWTLKCAVLLLLLCLVTLKQ